MRLGNIHLNVRQYADGRWGFDDYSSGQRHMVRLKTKQKAEARATDIAVCLANGCGDLRKADAGRWAAFRKWEAAQVSSPSVAEACKAFLALKHNKSSRHVDSLRKDLQLFEEFVGTTRPVGDILAPEIQNFLNSRDVGDRRKFNLRATIVSLFRWARRMSYLRPIDGMTEAEKVEPIEMTPGEPNILTPVQMRTLLDNVQDEYLPWLCIGGFAGIRSQEISPDRKSKKSPLMWEDFDWTHQVIIVRAKTAKTKQEREVPISENLAQWLAPYRDAKGPVCARHPTDHETRRLGELIGGWQHNALRDSFCSYRARITQDIPRVSFEMGNSIQMVRRSYHRRQPIHTAQEWFDIRPDRDAKNMVVFATK